MGLARIVAGCHFPSDVLWAGGVVYFTALVLAAPFRFGLGAAGLETTMGIGTREPRPSRMIP